VKPVQSAGLICVVRRDRTTLMQTGGARKSGAANGDFFKEKRT
jgi:hypothetical protein